MLTITDTTLGNRERIIDTEECPRCHAKHEVVYKTLTTHNAPEGVTIAYYQCGERIYMVGINGRKTTGEVR